MIRKKSKISIITSFIPHLPPETDYCMHVCEQVMMGSSVVNRVDAKHPFHPIQKSEENYHR